MAEIRELDIDQIKIDREIQPREGLDDERVELFRELYLDKDKESEPPPPLTVFHDAADDYWLSDGFHRYEAALAALREGGPSALAAEIHEGDRRDAFLYAVRVNGKHGKELTRQEKRNAIRRMLQDDKWSKWSVRKIARHTGTSIGLVSNVRSELESQDATVHDEQIASPRTVTVERGGKQYELKPGNIGRGRKKKAQTQTTTSEPASPEVPQGQPTTDDNEERTADDNLEVVEEVTPPDVNPLPVEPASDSGDERNTDDNHVAVTTDDHDNRKDVRESNNNDDLKAGTNDGADKPTDEPESVAPQEDVTTKSLDDLKFAWGSATIQDRIAFLTWIKTTPIQDAGKGYSPEQLKRWKEAADAMFSG
jgi:hypothetical protein